MWAIWSPKLYDFDQNTFSLSEDLAWSRLPPAGLFPSMMENQLKSVLKEVGYKAIEGKFVWEEK